MGECSNLESGEWDNPTCDRVAGMKTASVYYLVVKRVAVVSLVEWNCMMSSRLLGICQES